MTYGSSAKKLIRAVSAALAALILLLSFASCSTKIKPVTPDESDLAVVGKVAGRDVCYDELRYLVLNFKDELADRYADLTPSSPDADKIRAELRDLVVDALTSSDYYAVTAMADEYYQGKSDAMLAEQKIADAVAEEINELADDLGGKKAYFAELKANYMTDRLMRFYLSCEKCATELIYILKNDFGLIPSEEAELKEAVLSTAVVRTNHLYLKGLTEENRKKCEEARLELIASGNRELEINIIKTKYRDADYTVTTSHGAYFSRYTSNYGDAYEKAAIALSAGEVSEVVEGDDGYFVILRLPLEEDYVLRNFETIASDYITSQFNIQLDEFRKSNKFEFNEYGGSLDLLAIE